MRESSASIQQETPAEGLGFTSELAKVAARLAGEELRQGRARTAREIAEGLAVMNPHDPAPWLLLAQLERRRGHLLAARVCAEVAWRLAPADLQTRLVRAELLLAEEASRLRGREELQRLAADHGPAGERARTLIAVLDWR